MEPDPPNTSDETSPESSTNDEGALRETLERGRGISVGEIAWPATIVFKSNVESTSVYVDEQGNVSVSRGALPNPDIVIEGEQSALCEVLQRKEPSFAAPGALRITVTRGSIQEFVTEISEGQEMVHPLREFYD